MIIWLWDLLFHRHKWLVYAQGPVGSKGETIGFWTKSKCEKCGNHKYKQHY